MYLHTYTVYIHIYIHTFLICKGVQIWIYIYIYIYIYKHIYLLYIYSYKWTYIYIPPKKKKLDKKPSSESTPLPSRPTNRSPAAKFPWGDEWSKPRCWLRWHIAPTARSVDREVSWKKKSALFRYLGSVFFLVFFFGVWVFFWEVLWVFLGWIEWRMLTFVVCCVMFCNLDEDFFRKARFRAWRLG